MVHPGFLSKWKSFKKQFTPEFRISSDFILHYRGWVMGCVDENADVLHYWRDFVRDTLDKERRNCYGWIQWSRMFVSCIICIQA
jgi:hypothetical protein